MMQESSVCDIRLAESTLTLMVQICRPGFLLTLLKASGLSSLIMVLNWKHGRSFQLKSLMDWKHLNQNSDLNHNQTIPSCIINTSDIDGFEAAFLWMLEIR